MNSRRLLLSLLTLSFVVIRCWSTTVYTRVGSQPAEGWAGTYIIVYQMSETKAYVWNGTDDSRNYVEASILDGKIYDDNLTDYQIKVAKEGYNTYSIKAQEGFIGAESKKNGIEFAKGSRECTIRMNGGYVQLETNSNTERFVYHSRNNRFRFYYDQDKKWSNTDYKNIYFYVLGDVEIVDGSNVLDINYAQADMYACDSKFPTSSNPYDQYFYTELFLANAESYEAIPQIGLEILAPSQYSLVGESEREATYKSTFTEGKKLYINTKNGAKHSYFWFPSKAAEGYSEAAINLAEMTITKVGASTKPNAYVYHIKLEITDSNRKIWKLDKNLDVYAWWIDCDRSGKELKDMDPVAFSLESGKHESELETALDNNYMDTDEAAKTYKVLEQGHLCIIRNGIKYDILGR